MSKKFWAALTCCFVGFFIGWAVIGGIELNNWKKEAISLGHAQYNPTNANFEWKVCK